MVHVYFEPNPKLDEELYQLFTQYNNACSEDISGEDFEKGFDEYIEKYASKDLKDWLDYKKAYVAKRNAEEEGAIGNEKS